MNNPNIFSSDNNINSKNENNKIKKFQNKIFSIIFQLMIKENKTNNFIDLTESYDPEYINDCFSTLDIDNYLLNNILHNKESENKFLNKLINKLTS